MTHPVLAQLAATADRPGPVLPLTVDDRLVVEGCGASVGAAAPFAGTRVWLDAQGIDYAFHDYKKAGADEGKLKAWIAEKGWETILNRAGTTFKKLPDADKAGIDDAKAIRLMLEQPSMIKRPVVEGAKGGLLVGFKQPEWEAALS